MPLVKPVMSAPELVLVFSETISLVRVAAAVTFTASSWPRVGSNRAIGGVNGCEKLVRVSATVAVWNWVVWETARGVAFLTTDLEAKSMSSPPVEAGGPQGWRECGTAWAEAKACGMLLSNSSASSARLRGPWRPRLSVSGCASEERGDGSAGSV